MPDEPPSQMIRIPTPLIDAVRELSRLHRAGRTKAVLEGVQKLVTAIDSEADVDIDSIAEAISKLTERLDRMEAQQSDTERLEKVENDINSLALTIADLNVRVSDLEGVDDIGYAVTPLSQLEPSDDISQDIEVTPWQQDQDDITADVEQIADIVANGGTTAEAESPSQPVAPLTQSALATRLGISDKAIQKHRQKGKESFAQWSRDRDPDDIAWTWEGAGGRGQPLRFVPLD